MLMLSQANPCDKRFQFQQRRFLFHKHSLPYDLPRRYCSSKPVPKNDQQLNGDAIDLEGFPGPGDITEFVKMLSSRKNLTLVYLEQNLIEISDPYLLQIV